MSRYLTIAALTIAGIGVCAGLHWWIEGNRTTRTAGNRVGSSSPMSTALHNGPRTPVTNLRAGNPFAPGKVQELSYNVTISCQDIARCRDRLTQFLAGHASVKTRSLDADGVELTMPKVDFMTVQEMLKSLGTLVMTTQTRFFDDEQPQVTCTVSFRAAAAGPH